MRQLALDTNAYSALAHGNLAVVRLIKKATDIALPITVVGELYFGISDGNNSSKNTETLKKFLNVDRVKLLHIDEQTAQIFGEIATELKRLGKPVQQNDIWIAALCKQHNYELLSNDKGFKNIVGLVVNEF